MNDKIKPKGRGQGLEAEFLNFKPPSVNLEVERVKLEISNLVHGWTSACPISWMTKSQNAPKRGVVRVQGRNFKF